MENVWVVAGSWMEVTLMACVVSIRLGISVAVVKIVAGVIGGHALGFHIITPWIDFLAIFVSLQALLAGSALIVILRRVKISTKFIGVWSLTRVFRLSPHEGHYTTLLKSTGLSFSSAGRRRP